MPYAPVTPHDPIEEIATDLFMVRGTVRMNALMCITRNMAVVRHAGELSLVDPIRLDESAEQQLRALELRGSGGFQVDFRGSDSAISLLGARSRAPDWSGGGTSMSPALYAFVALFLAVWVASIAWPIEVLLLLRQLRRHHPAVHADVVAPFSGSWTTMWNPAAIIRVFRFVWRRQDEELGDPRLSYLVSRMRLPLLFVPIGWLVLLYLLAVLVPGHPS